VFNKPNLLEYKHTMETLGRKKHGLWQEREASSSNSHFGTEGIADHWTNSDLDSTTKCKFSPTT
jgi:hypothetical protein